MKVAAVILTYNAPDTVVLAVHACLEQTRKPDAILVVDNCGNFPAQVALQRANLGDHVVLVRTEENLGPAGGFSIGLAWAVERGFDVWVMDDDCAPEDTCLERLIARSQQEETDSVIFPQEIDGRNGHVLNYPAWAAVLIPRSVIQTVGLPRPEFFWWMEDTEYLVYRMRQHSIPVIRDDIAHVIHARARRQGPTPAWKLYYETRNSTYMRHHVMKRGLRAWRKRIVRRFGYIVLRSPNRFRDLRAFLLGLHDGYRQRLGKRYPVP